MKRAAVALVALAALTLGWWLMPFPWLLTAQPPDAPRDPGKERFAEDRDAPPAHKAIAFDAARAMGYLRDLCAIGPRISGSDGMSRQQKLLKEHFEKLGATVTRQEFPGRQPSQARPVDMANLVISFHPERKDRVILCGHYDTRPLADQEPDRRNWTKPFVSANDGTSTVAFLMEFAHHVKGLPLKPGLDFVIFDGEEWVFNKDTDKYFLGSEHFARLYRERGDAGPRYRAAILLDLFAGKDARFQIEHGSHFYAGGLVEQVWDIAADLKCPAFVPEMGPEVLDDHLALNKARIPAIDIIDFGYEHWHRLSDTPEQCSGETMGQVAKVLNVWLQVQP